MAKAEVTSSCRNADNEGVVLALVGEVCYTLKMEELLKHDMGLNHASLWAFGELIWGSKQGKPGKGRLARQAMASVLTRTACSHQERNVHELRGQHGPQGRCTSWKDSTGRKADARAARAESVQEHRLRGQTRAMHGCKGRGSVLLRSTLQWETKACAQLARKAVSMDKSACLAGAACKEEAVGRKRNAGHEEVELMLGSRTAACMHAHGQQQGPLGSWGCQLPTLLLI